MAKYPHCDELVLHAPGTCEYCDRYPVDQAIRVSEGINFTGEGNPNKKPCPAEVRRKLSTINKWGGNVPKLYHFFCSDCQKKTSYPPAGPYCGNCGLKLPSPLPVYTDCWVCSREATTTREVDGEQIPVCDECGASDVRVFWQ